MKRGLVLGGASCIWDDLKALEAMIGEPWPWLVFATNQAGVAYPWPIDCWVTLHPENLEAWIERRRNEGRPMGFEVWGGTWVTGVDDSKHELVDHVLHVGDTGSSGFHAVRVALGPHECDRVVLAGVPMDFRPHFNSTRPWDSAEFHWPAWKNAVPRWEGRVRSLSGRTAELLGRPDLDWLGLVGYTEPVAEGATHGQ